MVAGQAYLHCRNYEENSTKTLQYVIKCNWKNQNLAKESYLTLFYKLWTSSLHLTTHGPFISCKILQSLINLQE